MPDSVVSQAVLLLVVVYFSSLFAERRDHYRYRRALAWIGGVALIPAVLVAVESRAIDTGALTV